MANTLKLPVGIDDFRKLRESEFYYVDKTRLIEQLLLNWSEVTLFTRPRRFGKTLNMSMLKSFFDIGTEETLMAGLLLTRKSSYLHYSFFRSYCISTTEKRQLFS